MPRDRRSQSKDEDVESFIGGGGSAPREDENEEREVKPFTVRFPKQLIDEIDKAINDQIVSESRNQWLMNAAAEKLERESNP
jgi:hypothetical protein